MPFRLSPILTCGLNTALQAVNARILAACLPELDAADSSLHARVIARTLSRSRSHSIEITESFALALVSIWPGQFAIL